MTHAQHRRECRIALVIVTPCLSLTALGLAVQLAPPRPGRHHECRIVCHVSAFGAFRSTHYACRLQVGSSVPRKRGTCSPGGLESCGLIGWHRRSCEFRASRLALELASERRRAVLRPRFALERIRLGKRRYRSASRALRGCDVCFRRCHPPFTAWF